jgi:hypothetical protein
MAEAIERIRDAEGNVLAMVVRPSWAESGRPHRWRLSHTIEPLQACLLTSDRDSKLPMKTSMSEKRPAVDRHTTTTAKAWVVLFGWLHASVRDGRGEVVAEVMVREGELLASYRGGVEIELHKAAEVLEFANGPYYGEVESEARRRP